MKLHGLDPDRFIQPGFLGLSPEARAYESAALALVQVPYDGTTSYRGGARNGPAALMEASKQVELYDPELDATPAEVGIHTLPPLYPEYAGPAEMVKSVQEVTAAVLADGKTPVMVGGEHSVTTGVVRAVAAHHREKLHVLQIDAHYDLRDAYEGTPYSHASVMRRLSEDGHTIHPVGIRSVSPEEIAYAREAGIQAVMGSDLEGDHWLEPLLERLGEPLYITVDVDGFDPSVIPGTGTPEPGGLGWYAGLRLLRRAFAGRRVVGFDINELAPIPGDNRSEYAAAKLLYKMIGYWAVGSRR